MLWQKQYAARWKNVRAAELDPEFHMFKMLPKESLFAIPFFPSVKPESRDFFSGSCLR